MSYDLQRELLNRFVKAGLRADDSAAAADVAAAVLREHRDRLIRAVRGTLSVRQIAALTGLKKSQVHNIVADLKVPEHLKPESQGEWGEMGPEQKRAA